MESIASRMVDLTVVSHPAIVVPSAIMAFPVAVPAPVPEPAKPCPVVQTPNIVAVSEITPVPEGQSKALPLVH